jgi:hypothetical protein
MILYTVVEIVGGLGPESVILKQLKELHDGIMCKGEFSIFGDDNLE